MKVPLNNPTHACPAAQKQVVRPIRADRLGATFLFILNLLEPSVRHNLAYQVRTFVVISAFKQITQTPVDHPNFPLHSLNVDRTHFVLSRLPVYVEPGFKVFVNQLKILLKYKLFDLSV
jgi:hypothetical protein